MYTDRQLKNIFRKTVKEVLEKIDLRDKKVKVGSKLVLIEDAIVNYPKIFGPENDFAGYRKHERQVEFQEKMETCNRILERRSISEQDLLSLGIPKEYWQSYKTRNLHRIRNLREAFKVKVWSIEGKVNEFKKNGGQVQGKNLIFGSLVTPSRIKESSISEMSHILMEVLNFKVTYCNWWDNKDNPGDAFLGAEEVYLGTSPSQYLTLVTPAISELYDDWLVFGIFDKPLSESLRQACIEFGRIFWKNKEKGPYEFVEIYKQQSKLPRERQKILLDGYDEDWRNYGEPRHILALYFLDLILDEISKHTEDVNEASRRIYGRTLFDVKTVENANGIDFTNSGRYLKSLFDKIPLYISKM